jgi:hypothetical protein
VTLPVGSANHALAECVDGPGLEPQEIDESSSALTCKKSEISEKSRAKHGQPSAPGAGDALCVPSELTAAERARWVDAADQIDGVLGRHQRGDISRRRWQQMRADVRRFVESGWAHRAYGLGWHPLELFGVDRRAPYARRDGRGLALVLNGNKVADLTESTATIETTTGARLTFTRKPVEFHQVVLVDQIAPAYRLAVLKREWTAVFGRLDRARPPQDVSEVRWRDYLGDLRRLAEENWNYPPMFFMDWDGCGVFPPAGKRSLARVAGGHIITILTPDEAICVGGAVFCKLPGDAGWQLANRPPLDWIRERARAWLTD